VGLVAVTALEKIKFIKLPSPHSSFI